MYKDQRSALIEQKSLEFHTTVYQMREDKAKITEMNGKTMEDYTLSHLADLYGLNPNMLPFALNFPLMPPNSSHPLFSLKSNPLKSQMMKNNESMSTKLQDFQHMYQQYANTLFENAPHGLIPPGHPLYSRQNSLETLKAENNKLQKENLELKKQLEHTSTKNSKH